MTIYDDTPEYAIWLTIGCLTGNISWIGIWDENKKIMEIMVGTKL